MISANFLDMSSINDVLSDIEKQQFQTDHYTSENLIHISQLDEKDLEEYKTKQWKTEYLIDRVRRDVTDFSLSEEFNDRCKTVWEWNIYSGKCRPVGNEISNENYYKNNSKINVTNLKAYFEKHWLTEYKIWSYDDNGKRYNSLTKQQKHNEYDKICRIIDELVELDKVDVITYV